MEYKTLVLDKNYQPICFISYRNLVKKLCNEKVDIESYWPNMFLHKSAQYPSVVRLRTYVRKAPQVPPYNRRNVFRRDRYICQYFGDKLAKNEATIDHVIPLDLGGKTNWENCVTTSKEANFYKGNRTLEQVGYKLINKPKPPAQLVNLEYLSIHPRFQGWEIYFAAI